MATILVFPLARRMSLVRKQAEWFGEQTRRGAELNLATQLQRQREVMARRGIDPSIIEFEITGLEAAIRAEVIRRASGGAA